MFYTYTNKSMTVTEEKLRIEACRTYVFVKGSFAVAFQRVKCIFNAKMSQR